MARKRYPGPHKLGDLCQRFGIPTTGAHRALRDVEMCFALLRHLHQAAPITAQTPGASAHARAGRAVPTLFADAA